jgi:hypothetical protein
MGTARGGHHLGSCHRCGIEQTAGADCWDGEWHATSIARLLARLVSAEGLRQGRENRLYSRPVKKGGRAAWQRHKGGREAELAILTRNGTVEGGRGTAQRPLWSELTTRIGCKIVLNVEGIGYGHHPPSRFHRDVNLLDTGERPDPLCHVIYM